VHRRALALVFLAVAAGAGAESPSLAVRAAGKDLIEAVNRQTLSLALTCESNRTSRPHVRDRPLAPGRGEVRRRRREFTAAGFLTCGSSRSCAGRNAAGSIGCASSCVRADASVSASAASGSSLPLVAFEVSLL
jgi:hypothetical protein